MTAVLTEFIMRRLLPCLQCDYCGSRAGTGLLLTDSQHYPSMNALGIFTCCLICGGVGSGMFAIPDWITEAVKPEPISPDEIDAAKELLEQPDWWQRMKA